MNEIYISHIKKGLIIAVLVFAYKLFLQVSNNFFNDSYSYVSWLIIILGSAVSVYLFSKFGEDNVTFNSLFSHGLKTTAVLSCLGFVGMALMVYVLFPSIGETAVLTTAKKNGYAEITINSYKPEALATAKKVMNLTLTAGTLMGSLVLGSIGSLIGAMINSKKA